MRHTTEPTTARPSWEEYWAGVGNMEYFTAKRLAEAGNDRVKNLVASFLTWKRYDDYATDADWEAGVATSSTWEAELDWPAYRDQVADDYTLSSTERRLALLVGAMTGHPDGGSASIDVVDVLGGLSEWAPRVFMILTEWATGDRCTVVGRHELRRAK